MRGSEDSVYLLCHLDQKALTISEGKPMVQLPSAILLPMFQKNTPLTYRKAFVVMKAKGQLRHHDPVNDITGLIRSVGPVYLSRIHTPTQNPRPRPLQPKHSPHTKPSPFSHFPERSHTCFKSIIEQCWVSQRVHRGDGRGLHITQPRALY